jgi:hypothetical protein
MFNEIHIIAEAFKDTSIDTLKLDKIQQLHNKYQAEYDAYLAQYPKREVATFATKQAEATAYTIDNTAPTPSIDAMVGGDATLKAELITAIMAKVAYLASQEGQMIAKRDAIKACETIEELEGIEI